MAKHRAPSSPRALNLGRRSLVAVAATAGIALTPLPAMAASGSSSSTAVNVALAQVGDPYRWGGAGPSSFDCSGLVQYAYRAAGKQLPHSSRALSRMGTPVAKSALRPGDLVFFYGGGHVGIYVGGGKVVHASTYGKPVNVMNMSYMPYYTARRV